MKVAILIPTMNRPEFLNRALNYYAKMKSPHPVYIGDSSDPENSKIVKKLTEIFQDKLEINYRWFPPKFDNLEELLAQVKEKYAVPVGDDDFEIPASLTRCAEFLENNPDYASASGYGITFRLKTSGPYGKIDRLADYPMHSLEAKTASQRLLDFMKNLFTITFGVNRVEHMRKIRVGRIPMVATWNELSEICSCAVAGKSKLLDCLGFVRQIHDRQYYANNMIDWLTAKDFHNSYLTFRERLAGKISEIDNIPLDQAASVVKESFWEYLQVYMAKEQKEWRARSGTSPNTPSIKLLRARIGKIFPILKTVYYRRLRPFFADKKQLHYEVLQPYSKYYKDFKSVRDLFSGKD